MNKILKGDTVLIQLGKDSGKKGTVEKVIGKEGKILVSGVNSYKRHVRKHQGIEGGIIDIIKPINVSNVLLVCPNCKKPTRVGFKVTDDKKERVCKKCQKAIVIAVTK